MDALFNPALLLGLLLVVGYASLFHLWTGRTVQDLGVYLLAAGAGFAVGQWAGDALQLGLFRIGGLHILETGVGALLALLLIKTVTI